MCIPVWVFFKWNHVFELSRVPVYSPAITRFNIPIALTLIIFVRRLIFEMPWPQHHIINLKNNKHLTVKIVFLERHDASCVVSLNDRLQTWKISVHKSDPGPIFVKSKIPNSYFVVMAGQKNLENLLNSQFCSKCSS